MFITSSKTIWTVAAVTVLFAVALATATFWILLSEQAGTFNLIKSPPLASLQRDLLQDIQRGASKILDVAATTTSHAVGDTQSAVGPLAASLSQVEEYVPLNCSFGMIRYCIGFGYGWSCSSSRLAISAFVLDKIQDLPSPLRDDAQARVKDLSSLPGSLSSLPTAVIGCLMTGSLSFITLLLLSFCVAYGYPTRFAIIIQKIGTRKQVMVHLGVGLICCVPYVVLVVVQHSVIRAVKQLPAWVEIEAGKVFSTSIGAMVFAIIFAAFSAILSGCICAQSTREVSRTRPSMYPLTDITIPPTSTRSSA